LLRQGLRWNRQKESRGAAERDEPVKLRQEALRAMAQERVKANAPNGAFVS
jgi:hypothetical protein